jgi:hypothetical protein
MASAERNVVAANSTPAVNIGSPRISSVSRPAESKPMLACGDGERDYFGTANGAILFMEAACMGLPCPDPDEDEDIILCAAFHGWDVASSKHVLDAGWQLLQLFDEGLFFRSETVERVVIMRILRSMSLVSELYQTCISHANCRQDCDSPERHRQAETTTVHGTNVCDLCHDSCVLPY